MEADENGYITFGYITYESHQLGQKMATVAETAKTVPSTSAINEHCTPSLCEEVRERSGRGREGVGVGESTTLRRELGSLCSLY